MSGRLQGRPVLVVGAGIMGAGIAQVAAQAGHPVWLHDLREGAAGQAKDKLRSTLEGLVAKGKVTAADAQATLQRISVAKSLGDARDAAIAVEAIVEKLEAKRSLLRDLEAALADDAVLATNTSSISITALANGLRHPERVVGMHFFNPVPLMKLVEVVSGLHTDRTVADDVFSLSRTWGKVPVHARSTPGFIVNRIARPFYAEALMLLQEQALSPRDVDACLRAAGFRMGPCELMDLIGHDTNFAVTMSVYEANFGDKRFVPSLVQRELVDGGLLGRKTGRGFFSYPAPEAPAAVDAGPAALPPDIVVCGEGRVADMLFDQVVRHVPAARRDGATRWTGLATATSQLRLTDGVPAFELAAAASQDIAVFDQPLAASGHLAYAVARSASQAWRDEVPAWLRALGYSPVLMADAPGLVVARTVSMLINEAADAVLQGVCTPEGADAAMTLGVNYPAGPFEWLARGSIEDVIGVIDALDATYRGERYRVSPWLRGRGEKHE
ncbi:3-hydroxyacyl-CoA dehydrogenase [Rhizobacter sp. Root1221]|uniref:3-hydroxyacyl-CoA dehydrogenase n=1 Tax=Rhizobacter sp. Root1221 TaxID=1736433 RepID=UPI0006F2467D|nr:3-hydroxyacyl-CoA dehydrogenase [Rhizobacter sp. Root1221]KQV94729.1 3-hydroxyacyl-CoA dehydrogenase [Rhizobacter sp. Root1221]